jgi:hypothetical protein
MEATGAAKDGDEPAGQQDSVLLSSFEVNRMKSIARAIKQGAEEQRVNHEKQIESLKAENALLRSERDMLRGGGGAARKWDGPQHQRQAFQSYNLSELTRDVERITRQLAVEASELMLAMTESRETGGGSEGHFLLPEGASTDALKEQISELEAQRHQMQDEMQLLQDDCADLAGEVNRLEDLNFLAETALLKYAGELEQTRTALNAATARVQDLEAMQRAAVSREGSPPSQFDDVLTSATNPENPGPSPPPGKRAGAARQQSTLMMARDVNSLHSDVEELQILALDIERDFHGTVQQAILWQQQREAAALEIAGLRRDAEMNAAASQMALEEALVRGAEALADRSLQAEDVEKLGWLAWVGVGGG